MESKRKREFFLEAKNLVIIKKRETAIDRDQGDLIYNSSNIQNDAESFFDGVKKGIITIIEFEQENDWDEKTCLDIVGQNDDKQFIFIHPHSLLMKVVTDHLIEKYVSSSDLEYNYCDFRIMHNQRTASNPQWQLH